MKLCIYALLLVVFSVSIFVNTQAKAADSEDDMAQKAAIYQQDMAKVEARLNNIDTMVSTFTQIAANGERSTGVFYLSRPGKLRWEYKEPTPLQITAKGNMLVYFDVELDQVSHVLLDDTLASFLTREHIRFDDDDIQIEAFNKTDSEIAITIAKKGAPSEGLLTLAFGSTSLEFQRMEVVDATGSRTTIFFESSVYGVPIEDKMFILPKFRGN